MLATFSIPLRCSLFRSCASASSVLPVGCSACWRVAAYSWPDLFVASQPTTIQVACYSFPGQLFAQRLLLVRCSCSDPTGWTWHCKLWLPWIIQRMCLATSASSQVSQSYSCSLETLSWGSDTHLGRDGCRTCRKRRFWFLRLQIYCHTKYTTRSLQPFCRAGTRCAPHTSFAFSLCSCLWSRRKWSTKTHHLQEPRNVAPGLNRETILSFLSFLSIPSHCSQHWFDHSYPT